MSAVYHQPIRYNDLLFRVIASLVGAHIVVVYGETKSTLEILLMRAYYPAMLGSFVIAFLLFALMRWIIKRLDKHFDWQEKTIERIGMQLLAGMIVPSIAAFMLAWAYFQIRGGVNILHTSYVRYDFWFIVALLLMINFYYVAYFFFVRWKQAEALIRNIPADKTGKSVLPSAYTVSKGAQHFILPLAEIAYFFRQEEGNFLRTFSGEDFFVEDTLDDIEEQLPQEQFFRANRQLVISREACKGFALLTYGKLSLQLTPAFDGNAVVSQKRAVTFKKWNDAYTLIDH